jgi:TolB-like protein
MKRVIFLITLAIVSGLCYAQTSVTTMDRALSDAVVYFENRLKGGVKVVILNMNTSQTELSDYIIDELAAYMVNNNKLTVIDRRNLEVIRRELNFQMSGDVSDETAQSIGRMLGAQYIISGSLTSLGDVHRLRVQALAVETAQIAGMINLNVPSGDRVIMALSRGSSAGESGSRVTTQTSTALPAVYDTGMKPEKKTPARRGNFEVIPGKQIRPPIDTNKFYNGAKTSLENLQYTIDAEGTGFILFTVSGGNWWAQIKLCYWNDEYWYEYVNSHNLGAEPARDKIHKNYAEWIKRVEKQLNANYR